MREHIHGKCDDIDVTGTLTISKQCTLDTVCTGQDTKLGICDTTSTIVMRVKRKYNILTVMQILAHVLNLACINMWQ